MIAGGCRCGSVRYEVDVSAPEHHVLCHCADCRRSSGAPVMAWLAVPNISFRVTAGEARCWEGESGSRRYFCPNCGTGLYSSNEAMLPGIVDIQSATLDEPERLAPTAQIQFAERLGYMATLKQLPTFERWLGG